MIKKTLKQKSYQFIILFGIVSMFGDITYEGGRSITGPYLALLGVSATMVGFIGGLGEFVGYAFRLVSGYFADKTKAYWPITFIGYGLLISMPLLALTNNWKVAAAFIILERFGKAVRTPAKDTMLSHATKSVGRGFGFAYGIFNTAYGASWFAGSLLMGFLYDTNISYILWFVMIMEAIAVLTFWGFHKKLQLN